MTESDERDEAATTSSMRAVGACYQLKAAIYGRAELEEYGLPLCTTTRMLLCSPNMMPLIAAPLRRTSTAALLCQA